MTDELGNKLEDALGQVAIGMVEIMKGAEELAVELQAMTEHYVRLAGCGDCGNWDPEKEVRVIAARNLLAEFAEAKRYFDADIVTDPFIASAIRIRS